MLGKLVFSSGIHMLQMSKILLQCGFKLNAFQVEEEGSIAGMGSRRVYYDEDSCCAHVPICGLHLLQICPAGSCTSEQHI